MPASNYQILINNFAKLLNLIKWVALHNGYRADVVHKKFSECNELNIFNNKRRRKKKFQKLNIHGQPK